MSLSIEFEAPDGDDGPFSLASASGWAAVGAWADGLGESYAAIKSLTELGRVAGTRDLARQLARAVKQFPPASKDVMHTVTGLMKLLGVGHPEETATVTE